jgi:Zn-dependent alcohol dehydrogenase
MKTRAAVLHAVGERIAIEELDLALPQADEVRIEVTAAGVCHSDWHLVSGDTRHALPVVLGHEGAGIVTATGPGVTDLAVGDSVALNWAPYCGACFYCRGGRPSLCGTYVEPLWAGTMMDGTTRFARHGWPVYQYSGLGCFAQQTVVPKSCCVRLPPELPHPVAALIGCAVTTGVGAVLNTAEVEPGSSVAVFGCGGVGLSMLLGAQYAGAETILAVDRAPAKRELARSFGATDALVANDTAAAAIRERTGGRGADYVFEAVGSPAVQEQCFDAARPGGSIVLAGLAPMGSVTNFPGSVITRQEKSILGSYYGSADIARDFPKYAGLYLQGVLPIDRLISQTYRLEEINEAFAAMLSGETARGVVLF